MMDGMTTPINAERNPVVFAKDGEAFANSRDVAEFFGKRHDNVLRDIDNLTANEPSLRLLKFEETLSERINPNGGSSIKSRSVNMTRDGFTLLAMGFTGAKALKWKLRYIEAFNAMEAELRRQANTTMIDLRNPAQMLAVATQLVEINQEQAKQIEAMREDVKAHERLTKADGSLCITNAAKNLGVRPKDLFVWMASNGWIYKRPFSGTWLGKSDKCNQNLLEHKTTTVTRADGSERLTEQVRVTAKGLAKLAAIFNREEGAAA